ncbi:hypothetical protein G6L24_08570 [Agrobacterium tumefaciens]|uniref:hypothetical protein n=1 Tax=Agrobacterium tumefaciens TaxID=358 RepID=UPI002FDA9407|nr:hypothetical protein [Agrobacterium tumefaciens]
MSDLTPISMATYNRLSDREWVGVSVVTLEEIRTIGGVIYPKGSRAEVTRKFGGLHLEGDPCTCCGVKLRLTKIPPTKLAVAVDESGGEA